MPPSRVRPGQALYLGLLWWLVVGNFERSARRVQTGAARDRGRALRRRAWLHGRSARARPDEHATPAVDVHSACAAAPAIRGWPRAVAIGLFAAALSIVADWAIVRAIYGDRFAGHARLHTRFGTRATTIRAGESLVSPRRTSEWARVVAWIDVERPPRPLEHRDDAPYAGCSASRSAVHAAAQGHGGRTDMTSSPQNARGRRQAQRPSDDDPWGFAPLLS